MELLLCLSIGFTFTEYQVCSLTGALCGCRQATGGFKGSNRDQLVFGLQQTNFIFRQVAQAVQALHGKATLHGDVKPDNFLVSPPTVVKGYGRYHHGNCRAHHVHARCGNYMFGARHCVLFLALQLCVDFVALG